MSAGASGKIYAEEGSPEIPGLQWPENNEISFSIEPYGREIKVIANVRGEFSSTTPYTVLVYKGETLAKTGKDTNKHFPFSFRIPIEKEETSIKLAAIYSDGTVFQSVYKLSSENMKNLQLTAEAEAAKKYGISVSLGPSLISYSQTKFAGLSETALTLKGSYTTVLYPPRWDGSVSFFYTLLPITTSLPGVSVQFLGVNLRAGYIVPGIHDPWRFSVAFGWYYNTLFAKGSTFGYSNVSGPQCFPVLKRVLPNGNTVTTYIKYSPVSDQLGFLDLSSREMAGGIGWVHPLKNLRAISVTADYANITLALKKTTVSATSISLAVGYGF